MTACLPTARLGQVDGWLPAATLALKEDHVADIAAAIRATGSPGSCRPM